MIQLYKKGYSKTKWNSIINKTPVTYSTNREIGGVAPSQYLNKIETKKKVTHDDLNICLESHLINTDFIRSDDFDKYFLDRASRLLDIIGNAMGKPITNRDNDEIIKEFGGVL